MNSVAAVSSGEKAVAKTVEDSMLKVLLSACTTMAILCAAPLSAYAKNAEFLMRISHTGAPGVEFYEGWEKFAQLAEARTEGRLKVQVYPMSQLGTDRVSTEAVQAGNLECASLATNIMSNFIPAALAFDLPYTVDPRNDKVFFQELAYGELNRYLVEKLGEVKLFPILFNACTPRSWGFKGQNINTLADMKGLKVRATPSEIDVDCGEAAGMNPTVLSFDVVHQSLQQGIVDGELLSFSTFESQRRGGLLNSFVVTAHNFCLHIGVVNTDWWAGLPQDIRDAIMAAAKEAQEWEWEAYKEIDAKALEYMKQHNVNVHYPTDAEMAEFKAVFASVREQWRPRIDARMLELIEAVYK